MIKIAHGKYGSGPMCFCDACEEPIVDAKNANVLFVSGDTGSLNDPYVCHNGACDRALEAQHGKLAWMPLSDFLRFLMKNTGLAEKLNQDEFDGWFDVVTGFPGPKPIER